MLSFPGRHMSTAIISQVMPAHALSRYTGTPWAYGIYSLSC